MQKLQFEDHLPHQKAAIDAVVKVFDGQQDSPAIHMAHDDPAQDLIGSQTHGNTLVLSEAHLLENIQQVQRDNGATPSEQLDVANNPGLHLSIEMETGTGKTYVYLRTMYELHQRYGWTKFVIVVPSVAIREGVMKSIEMTHEHLQSRYDHTPIHAADYDSKRVSALRAFASSTNLEVLVMNIDAFAKDENIINRPNDKLSGLEPIRFIQATQPVVIVDEPQNMETEKRKAAIAALNPLCTLRYSATHKHAYHLLYSLNPVAAYDQGLVKQIEVDSVMANDDFNDAYVELESIKALKTKISARVWVYVNQGSKVTRKKVTLNIGDDLFHKSNGREIYKHGYILNEIDNASESITFSGGTCVRLGHQSGGMTDAVMRYQLQRTIEEHLDKQLRLLPQGIKVLSLIFIDKVANYREYHKDGSPSQGKFAQWFELLYVQTLKKARYDALRAMLADVPVKKLHNGYFSADKKGILKDTRGNTKADDGTYALIMRDKEKLLDLREPLQFIFSHSALREGWDNPNVFQICTLNETKSDIKKRQEIGRGLRLCVNQDGVRVYDKEANRLTIVANESYEDFAKALQQEISDDFGLDFSARIKNKAEKRKAHYRKGFELDPLFLDIWQRVRHKTVYRVQFDEQALVETAAKRIQKSPAIQPPKIRANKAMLYLSDNGVDTRFQGVREDTGAVLPWFLPNMLRDIEQKTQLTRHSVVAILKQSGRIRDALTNPQVFLNTVLDAIRIESQRLMVEGIEYEKTNAMYTMQLPQTGYVEVFPSGHHFEVNDSSKTIMENLIPLDSGTEHTFARDCESSTQVQMYFKLPPSFKIPTPIGNYNPDWAVLFEEDSRLYFVAETKSTGTDGGGVSEDKLRTSEQLKIACGKAHFSVVDDVHYCVCDKLSDLIGQ